MHVLPEIASTLQHGAKANFPNIRADAQNAIFAGGLYTTVSLIGDPDEKRPNMERLDGLDEAWAFCYRSPKPGWRIFGRFVAIDVFVGTALWNRNDLGSRKKYNSKAADMLSDWEIRFPRLPIVRGQTVQDYLTGSTHDVDQPSF